MPPSSWQPVDIPRVVFSASVYHWRKQLNLSFFFFLKANLKKKKKNHFFAEQATSYYRNSKQESEPGPKWSVLIRTLKYFNAYTLYFCELDYIAF